MFVKSAYLTLIIAFLVLMSSVTLAQDEPVDLGEPNIDQPTEPQTQTMPQTLENMLVDIDEAWMLAPMRTGHKNGIYSLAGYGRMETARALDPETVQAGLNIFMATFGGEDDNDPNFDGSLTLMELEGRYGIMDDLEAGLRVLFGGWEGTLEVYNLPLNSETGTTLGDIFLHAKYRFMGEGAAVEMNTSLQFDVAALLTLKLPVGSQDDVMSTGGFDISLNLLSSIYPIENLAINFMIGFTSASDGDTVQPQENRTWGMLMNFGIGGAYKVNDMISLILQTEFYDPTMDLTFGARAFFEAAGVKMYPELGFTYGLYTQAADFTVLVSITVLF